MATQNLKPFDGQLDDDQAALKPFTGTLDGEKPRTRSILETANDLVIEGANAAAGGVSSLANMVRPGNSVSSFIDENIIKAGEAKQSDIARGAKQALSSGIDNADGIGGELAAVGKYVVQNPGLALSQAAGSFALPGGFVKGAGKTAQALGAGAKGVERAGRMGGIGAGAAMAGGDAAGTAYDLSTQAGATDEQAVAAGRQASVIPALVGGAGGAFGAEKLLAGGKGFSGGLVSRALKTGASEAGQEAFEEGITQYEGQRAAMPYDATIDPTKGVAGAAAMGAALGGITGAGVSLISGDAENRGPVPQPEPTPEPELLGLPAPTINVAPDGTAQTASDRNARLSRMASGDVVDVTPVKRSEAMGINPDAGPLSRVAADAVDTGVSPQAVADPFATVQAAPAPVSLESRSVDDLRQALRNAQDPAIRKAVAAEIRKRREALPDPFQAPTQVAPNVVEAAQTVQASPQEPQAPAAIGRSLTDSGTGLLGRAADPIQSIIEGENNDRRKADRLRSTAGAGTRPGGNIAAPSVASDVGGTPGRGNDTDAVKPVSLGTAGSGNTATSGDAPALTEVKPNANEATKAAAPNKERSAVRGNDAPAGKPPAKSGERIAGTDGGAVGADQENRGLTERPANWRTNAIKAGKVARSLGLDPKGKRLKEIVAEVDAVEAGANVKNAPQGTNEPKAAPDQAPAAGRSNAAKADGVSAAGGAGDVQADGVTEPAAKKKPRGVLAKSEAQRGKLLESSDEIERVILSSIADGAIKRNRKYYDEQVSKGRMDRAEADRRSAVDAKTWSDPKSNDRTQRLAKAIAEKDPTALVGAWAKDGQGTYGNEGSMEAFRALTGINLKRMNSADRAKAIFDWAGWSEDQVRADVEKRKAAKAKADAEFEAKEAAEIAERVDKEAGLTELRIKGDGGVSTVKAYIDGLIAQGYTDIGQTKKGAVKQVLLFNPKTNSGYPMSKGILTDYAKIASERFAVERAKQAQKKGAAAPQSEPTPQAEKSDGETAWSAMTPSQREKLDIPESLKSQQWDALTVDEQASVRDAISGKKPTAKDAVKPAEKIEDFGEKILGARKDYATKLKEAQDVDISAEPLSKSWPDPDYQKLIDGGADPEVVAFVRAARDEIPTKPQSSWKLKGWVASVKLLRDMSQKLLSGEIAKDDLARRLKLEEFKNVRQNVGGRQELYQAVGHEKSLKGMTFMDHHYSLYKGETNVTKWTVEMRAKSSAFGNWPREIASADTKEEALAQFVKKYASLETGPKSKGAASFVIYRKRGESGAFVGKKIGREYVDLHKAEDVKAARAYLESSVDKLEKALERYKDTPYERGTENAPRVGGDHRNGAPVTAEVFAETFGFRGVQFGNYVEQGRRQSDLNEAFDALMDMAAILDIPPRAISLSGRLGLAFGARGKGGKNAPVATYESGQMVINLTKGGGPGSLAHEWFHAMDNYFARQGGDGGYMTDSAKGDALRAEMRAAFKAIKAAINAGALKKRSLELDKRKTKPYWSTALEMSARSFESYITAKLRDQNASNDYLANIVDPKVWDVEEDMRAEFFTGQKAEPSYPYPTADEMPAIRAAFDDFFKTVQTRENDAGNVEMYYGTKDKGQGTAQDRAVMAMAGDGKSADDILAFIANGSKSPFNRQIARLLRRTGANPAVSIGGDMGGGQGFKFLAKYSRKNHEVTLSEGATYKAEQIFLHETVHAATLMALDKGGLWATQMNRLFKTVDADGGAAGQYGLKNVGEFVAEAFTNPEFQKALKGIKAPGGTVWDRFVNLVRRVLGLPDRSQDALSAALELGVEVMRENATLRKAKSFRAEDGPAFAGVDQTETEAFKKWFAGSKVVDAQGKPLRVFHGTTADFSEFNPLKTGSASDAGWYGDGFYFTPDPQEASEGYAFKESGSNVMPVYLSIKNPYDWRSENKNGLTQNAAQASLEKRAELQSRGFDGVFVYEDKVQLGKDQKLTDEQRAMFSGNDSSTANVFGWDFVENSLRRKEWDFQIIAQAYGYEFAQSLPKSTRTLKEIVAFRPEQIKSATGNNGNFDPNDPDISHFGASDAIQQIKQFDVKSAPKNTWAHYRGMAMQALGRRQIIDLYSEELPQLGEYDYLVQKMDAEKNDSGAEADGVAQAWGKLDKASGRKGEDKRLADMMHDATLAQIDPDKPMPAGVIKSQYDRLKAQFDAMSPQAQDLYRQARDMYMDHYNKVQQAIKERVERSEMSAGQKRQIMAKMDEDFFKKIKGVYFPLARFGQYVIVVKDANGEVKNVTRAESVNEAEEARKALMKAYPAHMGNTVGKVLKQAEFNAGRDAVGKGFMADLMNVLDEKGINDELRDTVAQLYLSSLPDLSWAKHGLHRKGTPGFSQDARRAFAQNMFHGARYLAKLRYADQLQDQLIDMQDHVKAYEGVDEYDSIEAQQVVDEMVKRHELMMNPKTSPVSTALTSFGFLFHMGLSPASAMVNLTQTALVAFPQMGAKWGFTKASAALLKASEETVKAKNDLLQSLKGAERDALERAIKDGTIDVTMAHDLAGISQGEDQRVMWKVRPVMRAASFMFHHAEKFNRQATFLAAYRLAKEADKAGVKTEEMLYEEAKKATYDGHFDYAASNRARVLQGNWQKVIFLFKQFAANMLYTLGRNAYKSIKAIDPKERSQARKTLAGILAAHAAAAGVLGLPVVGQILTIASWIGGDDDEPWDAEVAMQNAMAEMLGKDAAEVMARGLSRLTPFDISGRVALDKLILPDVYEGLEGKAWAESAMSAALGPVAGIGVNVARGMQKITDGDYMRGLEDMMPAALRGPLKALRYAEEGAVDKSGIVITDDVKTAGIVGQALGLSPSQVRRDTERRGAIYGVDKALTERRAVLMRMFADARMNGDEDTVKEIQQDILNFNQKNPNRRITGQNLIQSIKNRRKRIEQAKNGIYLPKNRRDAIDAVDF